MQENEKNNLTTEAAEESVASVSEKKTKKAKIMKIIKTVFLIAVFVFMGRYFYKNWDDIRNLDIKLKPGVFIASVLLYFAYKLTLASLWHYITWLDKASIRYPDAITAYLYSILGKYIPGKVFMLAARIPAYEEQGVTMRKVTVCFLLENVCTLLGAGFLFLISLFFFPNDLLSRYMFAVVIFVIAFFICINPKIINFFLRIVGKLVKKNDMEIPFSYFQMIKVVLLFIANWLIVGTGFYMLTCSIFPVPMSQWLYVGGIYGLSAIIGIISIFAPSGIGVREGILIMGLNLIMPDEYSVIISIVSRIWATVAELVLILAAFIINLIKKHINNKKNSGIKADPEST